MYEVLRELHEISEWKDNSVYKTKFIKDIWIDWDGENYATPPKGFLYATKSDYAGLGIRRK